MRTVGRSWALFSGDDAAPGMLPTAQIWECPQLLQVDDAWLLVLSWFRSSGSREEHGVSAALGALDTSGPSPRFQAQAARPFDAGPDRYAPQLCRDGDPILAWAWSWEGRGEGTNRRPLADVDAAG